LIRPAKRRRGQGVGRNSVGRNSVGRNIVGREGVGGNGRYTSRVFFKLMPERYWVETLGCPKNQVDSDKLTGLLGSEGMTAAGDPQDADLVVINTCAFIEAARQESIETILALDQLRKPGARLVVTGCMAERYGDELARALPEVDHVAGFGVPVALSTKTTAPTGATAGPRVPAFDLLNLPRPAATAPWAYVKVAEGCDRRCGFCAIPSFRGKQRSRTAEAILVEVEALGAVEVVLVAQDLAAWGRDRTTSARFGEDGRPSRAGGMDFVGLVNAVADRVPRVRLLYLYPSELDDGLIDVIGERACAYYDLSLQHVSRPLLKSMRRWGEGHRFASRIAGIRRRFPDAAFRSSFIVGYPGETEEDHEALLGFLQEARLDWAGFFAYSAEEGTYAAGLADRVAPEVIGERLAECGELQDRITAAKRIEMIGREVEVLVDSPGVARGNREAPEIDGIVRVPRNLQVGSLARVRICDAVGPDLQAVSVVSVVSVVGGG
jgi:ribosomal protein S12 methylthiotransferase